MSYGSVCPKGEWKDRFLAGIKGSHNPALVHFTRNLGYPDFLTLLKLSSGDYSAILGGPLFQGFTTPLPAFGSLESYLRSNLPSVTIPSVPSGVPSIPSFGLPRFF